MSSSFLEDIMQMASLLPGDQRLQQFCIQVQEPGRVTCEERQKGVDYLINQLEHEKAPDRKDVLTYILYAITDVQAAMESPELPSPAIKTEKICLELLQSRSGQYLRPPRVLKDVAYLLALPKQVDSPIRPQLKLLGLLRVLPLLDSASIAETLQYYLQLRELLLDPEIINQAVFERASFCLFHLQTVAQFICRQPHLFFSVPIRVQNASVLRLLEAIAEAASAISAAEIQYCLTQFLRNSLDLTMTSVTQVKMYYWALSRLVLRGAQLLGRDQVRIGIPCLKSENDAMRRTLQAGDRMFQDWLVKMRLVSSPLIVLKK